MTPSSTLSLWDIAFWAERLREERYAYSDEELRPYFSLPRVLEGLFATAKRLFDVDIRPADGEVPVWDPSVRFFRVADEAGQRHRRVLPRPLQPSGEQARRGLDGRRLVAQAPKRRQTVRLPVAYLVCNMTPPVRRQARAHDLPRSGDAVPRVRSRPAAHAHHASITSGAAGINNVEWDAVELPSQFMENWCYTKDTMASLAKHFETGEPLPKRLFDKIVAARIYRAGSATLRQVYFATLDLGLHHRPTAIAKGARAAAPRGRGQHRHRRRCPRIAFSAASRTSSRAATLRATTATSGPRC